MVKSIIANVCWYKGTSHFHRFFCGNRFSKSVNKLIILQKVTDLFSYPIDDLFLWKIKIILMI